MCQQLLPARRRMLPNDSVDIGLDKTAGYFLISFISTDQIPALGQER
jgi:hypothetical protein